MSKFTARIALALSLAALTGCATPKNDDQIAALMEMTARLRGEVLALRAQTPQTEKPERACYLAGQVYSPGAVVDGRTCADLRFVKGPDYPPEWGWRAE